MISNIDSLLMLSVITKTTDDCGLKVVD